jgi:hypothetical protein
MHHPWAQANKDIGNGHLDSFIHSCVSLFKLSSQDVLNQGF